jgi:hypothetical protein
VRYPAEKDHKQPRPSWGGAVSFVQKAKVCGVAGLKDRFITIKFPELTEEGQPELYVTIRNPRLVPLDWLTSKVPSDANGSPLDPDMAMLEGYERIARLITGLRMYDAEDPAEDQALLEMPVTSDEVRKFPIVVSTRLAKEMAQNTGDFTPTPDTPTS